MTIELRPLTDEDIQKAIRYESEQAVDFSESELSQVREQSLKYYNGETAIKHEKGRSSVVVTKTRDTVRQMLPSIMRIFTQCGRIVEFKPQAATDVAMVRDQNDTVNSIFWNNGGYKVLVEGCTDALNLRTGIVKVTYEDEIVLAHSENHFLEPSEVNDLLQDENITVVERTEYPDDPADSDGDTEPSSLMDVVVTRHQTRKVWGFHVTRPDEFIVDKYARDLDDAQIAGFRGNKRVSDLVAMGFDPDDIMDSTYESQRFENEQYARYGYARDQETDDDTAIDPSAKLVLVHDIYMRIDADGDGFAELRHFITVGEDCKVLLDEPAKFIDYAILRADFEPGVFFPTSINETTQQDSDAQTSLLRSILDNASLTNSPRTVVDPTYANLEDLMNGEIGAIIRSSDPDRVKELTTPFIAGQTLPVLQYLDQVSQKRTGLANFFNGTDPDVLQSTTRQGVNAMVQGGQSMIEMVARNLAHGVEQIFRLIIKQIIAAGEEELEIPNGKGGFNDINTSMWHSFVDAKINVGLGTNAREEKTALLGEVAAKQEAAIMRLGPVNPYVRYENLRNTYEEIMRLGGYDDIETYFPTVTPQQEMQFAKMMAQKEAQNSDQGQQAQAYLAAEKYKADKKFEVDLVKAQAQHQMEMLKERVDMGDKDAQREYDAWKAILDDDRERDKLATDAALKEFDLENKYQAEMEKAELNAEVNRQRNYNAPN